MLRIVASWSFGKDLRYALRSLRRNPGFVVAAALTLALGIGANAAIFSVVDAYLLRPLPYRTPERLVVLWESTQEGGRGGVAMANYRDWVRQSTSFESLAAWSTMQVGMKLGDHTERIQGELATPNYLSLLGVTLQLGGDFGAQEETAHPVVIVSDAFWRSRMGGTSDAIGRPMVLGGTLFTVIGVLPPWFQGLSGEAQVLAPIAAYNLMYPQFAPMDFPNSRDVHFMRGIGRLKPSVSIAEAAAQMNGIGDRLAAQYPNEDRNRSVALAPAQADMVRNARPALRALFAAVALMLLVACVNVANLMLVRLSRQWQEMAVRTALGARRWHLLRQLWSESIVISTIGAALGVAMFPVVRGSLNAFLPLNLPKFTAARLDARLLLFACALTLATGAVLALLPMFQLRLSSLQLHLTSGARAGDARSLSKVRGWLATGEVALAVVLTVGAGLTIKSLWRLQHADPGYRADHLVTLRFDIPDRKYKGEAQHSLPERLAEQVQSATGVKDAAVTTADLLVWAGINRGFEIEGHDRYRDQFGVYHEQITPGYFRTLGIPLLKGRDFTAADDQNSLPVMIVSRAFAQRYLLGRDPIGKRMRFGNAQHSPWSVIVGLVGDAQVEDVHRDRSEVGIFYSPLRASDLLISLTLMVRTTLSPAEMLPALRAKLQTLDPDFVIYNVATLEQRIDENTTGTRSFTVLMAIFGAVAVSLALLGTYAVIAFSVAQRTREIGIRVALGAQRGNVLRLLTAQGARIVAAGLLIGLGASLALTRFLASMLFKVETRDPLVFAAITLLVGLAALAASYIPARRAAAVDPVVALRSE